MENKKLIYASLTWLVICLIFMTIPITAIALTQTNIDPSTWSKDAIAAVAGTVIVSMTASAMVVAAFN